MKEIERELSPFDKYYKTILFLAKLTSMLKNKFVIMRDMSHTRKTILFKAIMQEIILNRTRDDGDNSNN